MKHVVGRIHDMIIINIFVKRHRQNYRGASYIVACVSECVEFRICTSAIRRGRDGKRNGERDRERGK